MILQLAYLDVGNGKAIFRSKANGFPYTSMEAHRQLAGFMQHLGQRTHRSIELIRSLAALSIGLVQ